MKSFRRHLKLFPVGEKKSTYMKAALTTILILASLTTNAVRFYYYHYEGPSNYGGLYLMMILIGML